MRATDEGTYLFSTVLVENRYVPINWLFRRSGQDDRVDGRLMMSVPEESPNSAGQCAG